MDEATLIDDFGRHVEAGAATVLLGAGLSLDAGYPTWSQLLEPLRAELDVDPLDDLPLLAQFYADDVPGGEDRLLDHIRRSFDDVADALPTPAHRLLAQLPLRSYWTTNYDDLLDRAVIDADVVARDEDLAARPAPGRRRIYKMHGSFGPEGPIVITRDDYERYPEQRPRFWTLLQATFLTQSFLFLGFGFADPNLEVVFRLVRLRTPDLPRDHFALLKLPTGPDPDQQRRTRRLFELRVAQLERVGVHVCVIESYDAVESVLGRLVARCRPGQLLVSGSAPGTRPRTGPSETYPTDELPPAITELARSLAGRLADTDIALVAAGEAGASVGYELVRELERRGVYDPARFTLIRRLQDEPMTPPNLRMGTVVFTGEAPNDLRSDALARVRALAVLGGGEGTAAEVAAAEAAGLGVVPVAGTGGTAQAVWQRMRADLDTRTLGGRPVPRGDFELLNHANGDTAAAACSRLIAQAMYRS